jgi:hypothetical protein
MDSFWSGVKSDFGEAHPDLEPHVAYGAISHAISHAMVTHAPALPVWL